METVSNDGIVKVELKRGRGRPRKGEIVEKPKKKKKKRGRPKLFKDDGYPKDIKVSETKIDENGVEIRYSYRRGTNLNTPQAVHRFLSRLANQCANGEVPATRSQACATICRVILQALEQGKLAEEMEAIKDKLEIR